MEVGVTESAVLDIDVHVEVGGSNPADRKLLEVSGLWCLSEGSCLVGSHFDVSLMWSWTYEGICKTEFDRRF